MKHLTHILLVCLCLTACVHHSNEHAELNIDSLVAQMLTEIDTSLILPDSASSFLACNDLSQTVLYKKPSYHIRQNFVEAPEPLGFFGDNYQRFYIHWDTIYKQSPRIYRLEGRTRCKDQYCNVYGITAIQNLKFFRWWCNEIQGQYALIALQNDSLVGKIQGEALYYFITDIITENDSIFYSTDLVCDAQCGRKHRGVWIDLRTNDTLTCNWGDFRIPDSGDLNQGWGCFFVNKKYYDYGWNTLYDADHLGSYNEPDHAYYDSINQLDALWWK